MKSQLEQLRTHSAVVADTGDIEAIARFMPMDATTNPSLLLKAAALPAYAPHLAASAAAASGDDPLGDACDRLAVAIGSEIVKLIPGRVSTEVDARLSFDTEATVARARRLVRLYADAGIGSDRLLIKIAATWEGIRAAERLEREGIHCNLTLLFSFAQAVACAEAGVYLVSPFVGRILDWHLANGMAPPATPQDDPGVQSVTRIWQHYKQHGYDTVVMGASFRNTGQVLALAGCDRLTISPELLAELERSDAPVTRALDETVQRLAPPAALDEAGFRARHAEDAMAREKLEEGIRKFAADQQQLEALLAAKLG
ncbi:transaldolase [Thermomonas sp. XSG]|uniref:transaldolase n=1 Tax=Thermomonas sp. XSG TaxID=2771436 RepID=UPI00086908E5|nr:transaldolase [Thermomonas sp. XSG]ODU49200.1 MAG: transaldolase [Xanthomonadaceae bacterium SCN 69-48]QNU15258.1 transaldolase [Thermomonas sp. XSG]